VKIYLLCDMEGVSGLYTREHVWFWEAGVRESVAAEGRRLLSAEVSAAILAALDAGADDVVVCDTHHGGGNFLLESMPAHPRVTYECPGGPGALMPSLDSSFDGLLLLGHHAKAGTGGAFLDHTWSGSWLDLAIDGQSIGEIGLEACCAGHWNVPVAMVQGDDACCAEAVALLPGVVVAPVKRAVSFGRAAGLAPELARALTADKVREAVRRLSESGEQFRAYKPPLPMSVTLSIATTEHAERLSQRPGVHRLDGRTVECRIDRRCDVVAWAAT
jgi:D-amino peptidase